MVYFLIVARMRFFRASQRAGKDLIRLRKSASSSVFLGLAQCSKTRIFVALQYL